MSQYKCIPEQGAIRLGLNYVKGFGEAAAERVIEARWSKAFDNLSDFCKRTKLPRLLVENLIQAGAFGSWGKSKRDLLWELGTLQYTEGDLGLVFMTEAVSLPPLTQMEETGMEYAVTGLSTGPHPIAFYRQQLSQRHILSSVELNQHPEKQLVRVAGKVEVLQQPPTAKGILFMTLGDEFGFINVIVRPKIYVQFRRTIRGSSLLLVQGRVERVGSVTNLVATKVWALSRFVR